MMLMKSVHHPNRISHAEHNWFPTRKRFAASEASELATVLPIGNRRYGRFGNLRYVQRALNRYAAAQGGAEGWGRESIC